MKPNQSEHRQLFMLHATACELALMIGEICLTCTMAPQQASDVFLCIIRSCIVLPDGARLFCNGSTSSPTKLLMCDKLIDIDAEMQLERRES